MTILSRVALFAVTLLAAPALAAPVLKTDITVTTPVVTVGDMFDQAANYAEMPLFRSPAPGTTGHVSLGAITAAAARVGLVEFEASGVNSVRVARFGVTIETPLLFGLIETNLRQRGLIADGVDALTRFDRDIPAIQADAAGDPARLVDLKYLSATGQFTARFEIAGRNVPLDLSGRVDLMVDVPHLVGAQPAGKILTPNDVEMRPVRLGFADNGNFTTIDQVVGKQLRRPARDGLMLRSADLMEPLVVSRNDTVTLTFKSGPMTLTVRGQALNDAALGDKVSALNLMSSKVVSGIAVGTGAVAIGASTLQLANL